jgi:hypothetical protein
MNIGAILGQCYDDMGYKQTPAAEVTRRFLRYANEAQRSLVTMRGLARLRRSILTFASVADDPFAVLPQACVRIAGIQDRTSQRALQELSIQDLRVMDPGLTMVDSNPWGYVIINMASPVALQPDTADEVVIVSDDAADVPVAYIQGITDGGYPRIAQVTMTGTTAISFGVLDFIEVTKLYIGTAAVGTITVHQTDENGPELSRITTGRMVPRYTRIQLYGTPASAITYYADVDLHIEDFVNNADEPYLPEDFHWLIPTGIRLREYRKRQDMANYNSELTEWRDGVARLKAFCKQVTDTGYGGAMGRSDFSSSGGLIWGSSPFRL